MTNAPPADTVAGLLLRHAPPEQLEVRVDHAADQLLEARPRHPAELLAGLDVVADQMLDLGGPHVALVDADVVGRVDARLRRRRPPRARARCAPRRWRSRSRRARPAGASATSPRRSPWRSPSRARRRGSRARASRCSPSLMAARAMGDLAGDELEPAALGVVDDDSADAGAEAPLSVARSKTNSSLDGLGRYARISAGSFRRCCALGANPHSRGEIERVVRTAGALLDVDRGRLAAPAIQPAQALGEHGAVGLDRHAVPALQAVAGVVAVEERLGTSASAFRTSGGTCLRPSRCRAAPATTDAPRRPGQRSAARRLVSRVEARWPPTRARSRGSTSTTARHAQAQVGVVVREPRARARRGRCSRPRRAGRAAPPARVSRVQPALGERRRTAASRSPSSRASRAEPIVAVGVEHVVVGGRRRRRRRASRRRAADDLDRSRADASP